MLQTHKVQMKRSQLRTDIMKLVEIKNRTPEQEAELNKLNSEYATAETEYRSALTLNEQTVETDTGQIAYEKLETRASALEECWMAKIACEQTIDTGAVGEYRKEHGFADNEVDVNLLIGRVEHRADVPTPGPNAKTNASPISARVFRPTVLSSLGITQEMVSPSEHSYPVLTTGTTADMVAVDTAQESTAGAFVVTRLLPKEARGRITLRSRDLAVFPQFEASLRRDLGRQVDDVVSNQIINGVSSNAAQVQGLVSALTSVATPTGGVVNFAGFVNMLTNMVDGTYAASMNDLRVILGLQTWRLAVSSAKSDESDMYAYDWLSQKAQSVDLSSFIPNPPTSGNENNGQRVFATKSRGLAGSYGFPMWRNVQVVRDIYSSTASGHIHITANLSWNFMITRLQNWVRTTVKTSS